MALSYAEQVPLTCPRCGTEFANETFIIVDGMERPDLVRRVLDDTLHDTVCPRCGQTGRVPAPLLYHDASHERVLLAPPPGMPETEWREIGQTLLWTLIGALPETQRLPYLGNVQAENGLAGVAQIIRKEQLAGSQDAPTEEVPPIVYAIQALLQANGTAELINAFNDHPILHEPQAVTILQELAAEAIKQRQIEAADGFARAADLLEQAKHLRQQQAASPLSIAVESDRLTPEQVEALAFALIRSVDSRTLAQAVDEHPLLLEDWVDDPLQRYAAQARASGKQRIADGLDERLQAIGEMRAQYRAQQPILEAVQAYLQAETSDDVEATIVEYEALTTTAADTTLARLEQAARDDGDADFARFIAQRRTFLQQVRAALGDSE